MTCPGNRAGLGAITLEMAKTAKKVICVEKDREMVAALSQKLADRKIKNVEIINEDILRLFENDKLNVAGLKKYKVIANIPYYLTSALIRNILKSKMLPRKSS
jgi:16S rRNA (adenine1518-N6/adenine1519-N6)-dimethyltransferase